MSIKREFAWLSPILLLMAIGATLLLLGACQKEELWVDAVILDFGSPAVDGCGFVIQIENQIYYPVNLEEKYQIDGKNVKVQYNTLEEMHTCGFSHSGAIFQKINIRNYSK